MSRYPEDPAAPAAPTPFRVELPLADHTLYEWFDRSVRHRPDEPALEVRDEVLTYREVHRRVLALAARIVAEHGRVPDRIALVASRTAGAYIGYLAVQRLGASVVPLNDEYPHQRNVDIARRAGVGAVVAHEAHRVVFAGLPEDFRPTVVVVPPDGAPSAPPPDVPLPECPTDPEREAYLLFTSGSTGRPKGVPIRHRNVSPYVAYNIARYEAGPGSRMSQAFGLTFDPSVFDMFVAWGSGAVLVVPERDDLYRPVDFVVNRRITHWFSVPSLVTTAQRMGNLPLGRVTTLRHSSFSAEPVTEQLVDLWRQVAPGSRLHNLYGPTELTITCTDHELPADRARWSAGSNGTVPIGRPYPHMEAVVLDERGLPCDDGELCVRGPQRFDGYLDPADDAGRFLVYEEGAPAVPYDGTGGLTAHHWYRTGDRVRRENGLLVHRGRLDSQVKILGHRVEPGEVEAAMRRHPEVADAAVVVVRVRDEDRLVAAYLGKDVPAREFTRWLRERIPLPMVPRRIQRLEEFPYNGNGKLDRKRLAELLA
ncbi:amino acid adenylation domain-containing protein [Streptomyces sp. PRKS01-65]|nr:amino acid adenylation domain-containing protein [Streptomyces harenosi]